MSTAVDVQCKHQSGEDRVRINLNLYATNTNRAPFQSGASAPSRDILGCDFDGMITVFKNMVTIVENCLNGLPFFSAKAIASSLVLNASTMLDKGSALDWGKKSLQTRFLFWYFKNPDYYDVHSRGGPAHQWVFPAFPGVKIHLPLLGIFDAWLHGSAGGHKDTDLAGLNMLLGNASQSCDVLAKWGRQKKNW